MERGQYGPSELDCRIFLSILDLDGYASVGLTAWKDASVKRLFAPLTVLTVSAATSASPFVLEELVREGDVLPGLNEPVFIIGVPSINSSGEWAIPVSSPSPSQPTFQSGVLGNQGFRVQPGYDPDGSQSAVRTRYDSADIRDDGTVALVTQRLLGGSPSELWFGSQLAATSPGASFNRVSLLNDDTLVGSISTGAGGFTVVANPNGQGGWDSNLVHGFGTAIPVGTVLLAPTSGRGYAQNESGRQAWLGRIDPNGSDGEPQWSIAIDDKFIAVNGQESNLPGYAYLLGGGSISMQPDGDLFFAGGLEWMGEGPSQFESGIFREDGNPIITTQDNIAGLEGLGIWAINTGAFHIDENENILWSARATVGPGPDDPYGVLRSALIYNDTVLAQTGDVLADGSIVLLPALERSLSSDGRWVIVTSRIFDPTTSFTGNAVYRIAIPTPGCVTLGAIAGLAAMRRRRQR